MKVIIKNKTSWNRISVGEVYAEFYGEYKEICMKLSSISSIVIDDIPQTERQLKHSSSYIGYIKIGEPDIGSTYYKLSTADQNKWLTK